MRSLQRNMLHKSSLVKASSSIHFLVNDFSLHVVDGLTAVQIFNSLDLAWAQQIYKHVHNYRSPISVVDVGDSGNVCDGSWSNSVKLIKNYINNENDKSSGGQISQTKTSSRNGVSHETVSVHKYLPVWSAFVTYFPEKLCCAPNSKKSEQTALMTYSAHVELEWSVETAPNLHPVEL